MKPILNMTKNKTIYESILKTNSKIIRYSNIVVAVSGGSDSDVMLDMFEKLRSENNVTYVFIDTGLEYQATKDHLTYLECKYNVKIRRLKPKKPIPTAVKQYGVPFFSKYISEMILRLQKHGFAWVDGTFEELHKLYPRCKIALNWWCDNSGEKSFFNISRNKKLKEFLMSNNPNEPLSNKCCYYAKKQPAEKYYKDNDIDLVVTGIRKTEGGVRSSAYKSCFSSNANKSYDEYRPLFFYTDGDKAEYKDVFDVKYSDCYEVYGLKRTGCVGCPYSSKYKNELEVVLKYEPKLYNAIINIFGYSYYLKEKYNEFKDKV